jgi:hypothetical protein
MKICQVGAELFLADMMKQVVALCNFANTLKMSSH